MNEPNHARRLAAIVLLVCLALLPCAADAAPDTESIRDGIAVYEMHIYGAGNETEWIEKALPAAAGSGGEWYMLALLKQGIGADRAPYAAALRAYLAEHRVTSASTRQKYALVLTACGCADDTFVISTLADSIGQQGVMSLVFGLHLLNNGLSSPAYTRDDVISLLLDARKDDGGWAITGAYSDVDVTAMALQALAPYYDTDPRVREATDAAVALLSEKQLPDGGFMSYGNENPESISQVILALTSLGMDPLTDPRFIKDGSTMLDAMALFRLPDGSFCHLQGGDSHAISTEQVYCAMTALSLLHSGKGAFYMFGSTRSLPEADPGLSYKAIVCLCAVGISLILSIALYMSGKRHIKNLMFVWIICAFICAMALLINVRGKDEYYNGETVQKGTITGHVTLTIRCDTTTGDGIPADGVILPETEFAIDSDDTVYDILIEAARKHSIRIESSGVTAAGAGSAYIRGIADLYEFDRGDLSGWVYHVNGTAPSVGCGSYVLRDGDSIEWLYSLELGEDVK